MPRERSEINKDLPRRWGIKHGAYYYQVPEQERPYWNHQALFRLGKTLEEAHATFNKQIEKAKKRKLPSVDIDKKTILENAIPRPASGIYFLIKNEEIIYIGKAVSVFARLIQHPVKFDKFHFIQCEEKDLSITEKVLISKFKPAQNIREVNFKP
jgi:hypothetical protein